MPIDVHAHYVPYQLIDALKTRKPDMGVRLREGETPSIAFDYGFATRPLPRQLIESAESRRASLDRQRLDRQLVATWPDMYGYGLETSSSSAWHRLLNATLAEWVEEIPGRFSWVCSVPLPGEDAAADELSNALQTGAVAVMIPANVEGKNIGELSLDKFWAAAERDDVPIIIHPVSTSPSPRAAKFGLTQIVRYTYDTTLGVGSLIMSGVLDRFPRLRLVLSHGGGAFPYLAGRFDVVADKMDLKAQGATLLQHPSAYAPVMAYDTIVHSPKALRFLSEVVGVSQMVLGTDDSFPPADLAPLASLQAAGFSKTTIQLIADDNPRRIIPRLGA